MSLRFASFSLLFCLIVICYEINSIQCEQDLDEIITSRGSFTEDAEVKSSPKLNVSLESRSAENVTEAGTNQKISDGAPVR